MRKLYFSIDRNPAIKHLVKKKNQGGILMEKDKNFEELLQKAEAGDARAQYTLGMMYADGDGIEQDYTEALKWFKKAATQEYAPAQKAVGVMYCDGLDQDYAEAVKWFQQAADNGDVSSQFLLGCLYHGGLGVEQDSAKAIGWVLKSAVQDYADAQYQMGIIYGEGHGVEQDYEEAARWS